MTTTIDDVLKVAAEYVRELTGADEDEAAFIAYMSLSGPHSGLESQAQFLMTVLRFKREDGGVLEHFERFKAERAKGG